MNKFFSNIFLVKFSEKLSVLHFQEFREKPLSFLLPCGGKKRQIYFFYYFLAVKCFQRAYFMSLKAKTDILIFQKFYQSSANMVPLQVLKLHTKTEEKLKMNLGIFIALESRHPKVKKESQGNYNKRCDENYCSCFFKYNIIKKPSYFYLTTN